ncbi:hypothetical protein KFK09_005407 [Dendrobium nobile]|uniref:PUB domain-containing protein n=1 Tax=Dendrobium nobile TaxID=94219 RepID=A0A8T3BVQ9_DENNO|nr:hypothetical protein KFK09_005407 [Dendrobium nobile]
MRECLRSLKQNHKEDDAKVKRAFQTLLTYVGNVARNPNEEKFRKIRLNNATFQDRVGSLHGGIEFLEICGFEKQEGGEFLFLPGDKVDMVVLNSAGSELNSAITNPFFGILIFHEFFVVGVRLCSFDDITFLLDRMLRHFFDLKQQRELACCEVAMTKNFSGVKLEGILKDAVSFALNRQLSIDDRIKALNEENIKVTINDLLNSLHEIIISFGASTDQRCRLLEFAAVGPRFSNLITQPLHVYLESLPPKGKNMLVIGTTSEVEFLGSIGFCNAFSVTYHVLALAKADVIKVLEHFNVFARDDIDATAEVLDGMPLKNLYSVIDMAAKGEDEENSEAICLGKEKIDINYFYDILSDYAERRRKVGLPPEDTAATKPTTIRPAEEKSALPIKPVTKLEQMRDCLRSLKQNHTISTRVPLPETQIDGDDSEPLLLIYVHFIFMIVFSVFLVRPCGH